jgi:hypothetical protein
MEAVAPLDTSDGARPSERPFPEPRAQRAALRTLAIVALAGATVACLTWRAGVGLGWLAADAVLVVAVVLGVARGKPGAAGWVLAACSVWLAGAACWYASDWALATALPASLGALLALAVAASSRIRAQAFATIAGASLGALRSVPRGIVDAARLPGRAVDGAARGHATGVLRGALVGLPLAGIFALLLSADPHFRGAVVALAERAGDGLELALWAAAVIAGLLVAYTTLQRSRAAHEARLAALIDALPAAAPYRGEQDAEPPPAQAAPAPVGPRVRPLTWAVVLAQLAAVFGVYVAANTRTLFAGHALVRARGTLTYAQYLHEGFVQVSVATLLAVACVVVGHVLLRPRGGGVLAGGKGLIAVEVGLLALVAVTLGSCAHRLALYEDAYGYTYLRLGVWFLQLGAAGLLVMTAAQCVMRGWRGWGTALAWSAVGFAVLAGSVDADGWIARRNVARAQAGASLDVGYLVTLSEDARGVLPDVRKLSEPAADVLRKAWGASAAAQRDEGWRSRRGLGAPHAL